MQLGLGHSAGHYVDLPSAVAGLMFFPLVARGVEQSVGSQFRVKSYASVQATFIFVSYDEKQFPSNNRPRTLRVHLCKNTFY